ncbi:hypothetical protein, partial [Bacillus cereus]
IFYLIILSITNHNILLIKGSITLPQIKRTITLPKWQSYGSNHKNKKTTKYVLVETVGVDHPPNHTF